MKIFLILTAFCCLSPLYGQNQRAPTNINLIIDGSSSLTGVKTEVTNWIINRLDLILIDGDVLTIWSAGASARVIYTGTVDSAAEIESAKRSIRELSGSGSSADFSSALREAAGGRTSSTTYTLLISASQESLSSTISGPQGNLLRFSRVEEFSGWRALVVGLDLDARVRGAAASFFGN